MTPTRLSGTEGALGIGMKTTTKTMKTAQKKIHGIAYIALQADLASREGPVSPRLADLFFQCAQVREPRTIEQWDALVVEAMSAESSIQEAIEYGEETAG